MPNRVPLPAQIGIPLDVRREAEAIFVRASRIRMALAAPSAVPSTKARAKDELKALAKAAMDLWTIV